MRDKYPKFILKVGTGHPFAALLFQSIVAPNAEPKFSDLFPSITIADSFGTEVQEQLGRGYQDGALPPSEIQSFLDNESVVVSEEKLNSILAERDRLNNRRDIAFKKWTLSSQRNLDFNIWGENHDMVSIIYDMVEVFAVSILSSTESVPFSEDYILHGSISGRRSGDINVEFGKQLYGANVTAPVLVQRDIIELDVDVPYPVGIQRGNPGNPNILADYDCL